MRPINRQNHELRPINITRHFTKYAEGSVLISFGETKVLCNASIIEGVPPFLKNTGTGWVTAEYSMLPRATHERIPREAAKGKQGGRTLEIQRLIGRSLRAAIDLTALSEHTILVDCDVLQADGGTRTAAITGGCVALFDAVQVLVQSKKLAKNPFQQFVAAVSAGIFNEQMLIDLGYAEDSQAATDMNIVMTEAGGFIEIQGTAEKAAFNEQQLASLLALAKNGIRQLIGLQKASLALAA